MFKQANSILDRLKLCLEDKELIREIGVMLRSPKVVKQAVSELYDEVENTLSLSNDNIVDWVNQSLPHSLGLRQHRHERNKFWVYDTFDYDAPYYDDVVSKIARKVRVSEDDVREKLSEPDYFGWVDESLQWEFEGLDIDGNEVRLYGPEGGRVDPDIEMVWDGGTLSLWGRDSWVEIDKRELEYAVKRVKPETLLKYVLDNDDFDDVLEAGHVVEALVDHLYHDEALDITDVLDFSKKGEKVFSVFAKLISGLKKDLKKGDLVIDNIIANVFDR